MSDDLSWVDDMMGGTYNQEDAHADFLQWSKEKYGDTGVFIKGEGLMPGGWDKREQYYSDYAASHGTQADKIRQEMGLPDTWGGMRGEIAELRRVASEGLDPNEFRRSASVNTGGAMRGVTDKASKGMSSVGMMYGSELSGGLMQKYRTAFESQKVATFGSMLGEMLSKDNQTRDIAKQQLLQLILSKAEMDQMLVSSEMQRRAQLGG